ncbi:MAG TPA: iron ABC transporter permease [Ilumatobacter sp.]|nr:iron ABC transporter permease [Ilumatobacter sp.]
MTQATPTPTTHQPAWRLGAATVVLVIAAVAHLGVGSHWLTPGEVVDALGGHGPAPAVAIVRDLRLPRTLIGLAAGALLGAAGALTQAALRNPLASPDVTGATAGAVLAAVAFAQSAPDPLRASSTALAATAFAGGAAGAGIVVVIARGRAGALNLLLCGILVSGILAAVTSLLLLRRSTTIGGSLTWLVGSLNARTWTHWHQIWPATIVAALATIAVVPAANLMALGDTTATNLGLRASRGRLALLGVAVLATSTSVMVVGAVGFVGLVAPHIARRLVGGDHRVAILMSALAGAIIVTVADLGAQLLTLHPIIGDAEQRAGLPVGAATALIGAPWFLLLAARSRR